MDWRTRIPALILWLALVLSSLGDGNAEKRVVCYYTNWSVYRPGTAKFSPQNINPYLCTHLIYAFGGFTKENTLKPFDKYQDIEKGGYAKFTGLKTYNKNLKTMLAIGGWNEGSSRFSPMVADPKRRKEFVKNSVKFLRQNHFDGLDLDWEYPAFRDGGKPRDRNNYADLVQELREEFERESSKTGRPRLLLSMAVPAGIEYIDKGYDVPRLNDYLDFINLLSYDYHSAFEPAVNHHAPLYPLEEANEYNYDTELTIDYTIEHLLKSGASSEKIVLGIPTYGRSYTLFNEDATEIGAPADGPGEEGDATREKGYLAYYEICDSVGKSDEWEVVQPNPSAMGPYAYRLNQWVGYDDENIVRAKARYVNEKKLGGIMFWSIDNDDFRGKCHGRPYPLIEAAKEALLAEDERSTSGQKTKLSDNRKKSRIQGSAQRIQGNTIGRKLSSGNRRSTTQSPVSRRRKTSSRLNTQSNGRGGASNYNADEDEEDEEEESNSVKSVEKPRPRSRTKSRPKSRPSSGGRRKQQQSSRRGEEEKEESLSNKLTTPEPPTTPDPGSDFKCEDEGFFSHPRDCKKYFWCLDSGPGGLGIVGHQFTCPSGLVFNKAADSCDYPRNVVCPKTKPSVETVSTTRAPITAATSRTTYLYKPARTTTSKPGSDEEYEYYDDEEVADSEEVEEEPRVTTSAKPLLYKTISRSRPTTTTTTPVSTTTTETHVAASTRTYKATTESATSFEDEEDPRVIKELIDLIKKAGGIEQLEKQLNYQEKNSGGNSGTTEENGRSTPATISRSLYERVLNRQATRIAGGFLGSLSTTQSTNGDKSDRAETKNSRTSFVNGPGGAQFEGLDSVPEVKNLRRTNKPQYVTIERHRSPTSESPAEDEEEIDDEVDEDSRDVASSEDKAVSNPANQRTSNRRVTPSYVNIRRSRPSTTTSENDVEIKDEDSNLDDAEENEETPHQRHRVVNTEEESSSPKSRYTNTQRFRSTTSRNSEEDQAEEVVSNNDFTTESTTSTTTPTTTSTTPSTTTTTTEKLIPIAEEVEETPSSTAAQSSTTPVENVSSSAESTTSPIPESTSDSSLKLVENSATEILFTTAAASSSSTGSRPEPFTRGPSIAAVSQPRPFGFPRRGRPTASTSSVAPVTEQSRTKVVSEALRLPTLKELVGFTPTQTESIAEFSSTIAQSSATLSDKAIDGNALQDEPVDPTVFRDEPKILIKDLANREENGSNDEGSRDPDDGRDKEIFDNDILGSEEIQRRSSSSSIVEATQYRETIDSEKSIRRVEVPVRILDDANGEEIAELVILRLPESKLNSAILKPVFRVKVLEQDGTSGNDLARHDTRSVTGSNDFSSENELPDDRVTSPRRRRVRINSSPSSATLGGIGRASEEQPNLTGRPRNRQRIVKARRRTRVQEIASNDSDERTLIGRAGGGEEYSGRRESLNVELSSDTDSTTVQPTESSTAVRATTLRGNVTAPSKAPSVIRGFYVTKSSVEVPSTPDIITDPTTDSTRYPSGNTTDYGSDGTIERTDEPTHSDETVTPFAEGMSYIADESSTYESIGSTFPEAEGGTRISNDLFSLENPASTVGENLETLTTDMISTINDSSTEPGSSAATITEVETSEQPEVTTFRPLTSSEVDTTPLTTAVEGTTIEYLNDSSSEANVGEYDPTTDHSSETLKTSENSRYGDSQNLLVKSTTILTTAELDDDNGRTASELQSEISLRRTTTPVEKTTTRKGTLQRGRVRFTNASKPETSNLSSLDHQRIKTKTTKSESDGQLRSTTETYAKIPEHGSTPTTGSLQTSSVRRRDHRRRTTTSPSIDDSATSLLPAKEILETTGSSPTSRSFSRRKDHSRRTTTTSTQSYDGTEQYTSDEVQKTRTNFVETTGSALRSSPSDDVRRTTEALEDSDDFTIDSTTGSDSTNTASTETSEETADYASTTPEADYLSTNFVGTTGSGFSDRKLPEETETVAATTESFDKMTENSEPTNTVHITDNSEEEVQTEPTQSIQTTVTTETTRPWSYLQRSRNTGTTSVGKTETLDTSNEVTLDEKTDTFPPTTEIHLTTDRMEMNTATETEDSETKNKDDYGISTETGERTTETITSLETEATKQLIPVTTPFSTTHDKYDEMMTTITSSQTKNDNIVEATVEEFSPTYRGVVDQKSTTAASVGKITTVSGDEKSTTASRDEKSTAASSEENNSTASRAEKSTTASRDEKSTTASSEENNSTASRDEKSTTASRDEKSTTASSEENNSTASRAEKSTTASRDEKSTTASSEENNSTASRDEQKSFSTVDSSRNTIAPVTQHHEIKRSRGRVRFTNFAAHSDETGRARRPVKQVVVRRRPVTESNNRHRDVDASSEANAENETPRSSRHPNGQSAEETKNSVELHERFDEKENSSKVNVRLVMRKKSKKDSAIPHDRSVEETLSADPSDRSAEDKNSADPKDRFLAEKKYSSRTKHRSAENKNSSTVTDRSVENNNFADPNDRSVEEKEYPSQATDRLADDNKNRTKPVRRRVIVYRGRPRPEIVTSTTTVQSLRVSGDDIPDDAGRTRRRMWRKRVVLKRERIEEADDQSIAETVDFRRAMIDDSIADSREIVSPIEDQELASSAEHAVEDNGGEASGGFLRRPGSLVRGQGNNRSKTKTPSNSDSIVLPVEQPSLFSKIQPVASAHQIKTDDQSSRAQELAVTLADPPIVVSSATTGRLPFRTTIGTRKISTTIAPRTESPATSRTTPLVRRRQRPSSERIVEIVMARPRRPAIIDYDYYVDDDDVRLVVKPELKDKLFVTRKGGIRCLDQGNFAHPTSCKKFITCARMVNGQVIGTEYTCPDKLSFDPVGGICNWSAGLGCEDNKKA